MSALAVDLFAHAALSLASQVTAEVGPPPAGRPGRGRGYSPKAEIIYVAVVHLGAPKLAVMRALGMPRNGDLSRALARVEDARDRAEIERRLSAIEARIYGGER